MPHRTWLTLLGLMWLCAAALRATAQDVLPTAIVVPPVGVISRDVQRPFPEAQPEGTSRRGPLPLLYVGYVALQVFDGYATTAGASRGAIEANPLMRGLANRPALLWSVKGGVSVAAIYTAEHLWRTHHRTQAIAVMVVSNGIAVTAAARNASAMRGRP